jgi:copper homeostasis protein
MAVRIELCAASIEAIEVAKKLHLDRIELCQDLEQGGLTPSAGLIEFAMKSGLETHVLVRPRAGGFAYNSNELKVILNDVSFAKKLDAKGVVVGVLKSNFELDVDALKRIRDVAENMEVTFHRAFDETIDWKKSMNQLIELGFNRILTSGFASNVEIGFNNLKQMVKFAEDRIEIMPGGGVNAANISKILKEINPNSIHFSGTIKTILDEDSAFSETILKVDEKRVKRLVEFISKSNQFA